MKATIPASSHAFPKAPRISFAGLLSRKQNTQCDSGQCSVRNSFREHRPHQNANAGGDREDATNRQGSAHQSRVGEHRIDTRRTAGRSQGRVNRQMRLQRIDTHRAKDVEQPTSRLWKQRFADSPCARTCVAPTPDCCPRAVAPAPAMLDAPPLTRKVPLMRAFSLRNQCA